MRDYSIEQELARKGIQWDYFAVQVYDAGTRNEHSGLMTYVMRGDQDVAYFCKVGLTVHDHPRHWSRRNLDMLRITRVFIDETRH